MKTVADFIIVGGGSAGCVLASRLSERATRSVLLLEAGGEAKSFIVQLPAGTAKLMGDPQYDWIYPQDADPTIADRHFRWSGGRLLGGGSSINGQVHIRGTRGDYDNWERLGATGWNYDACLPYFIKSEAFEGPAVHERGRQGPMSVQPMRDPHPLNRNFLAACAQNGLPSLADYADGQMEGAFLTVGTQRGGWRCSTERAYLRPARRRANLRVVTGAYAKRVVLEGKRAIGVEVVVDGRTEVYGASRDIIISCGAMGSPGMLMRSGIGPAAELQAAEIQIVHDAPEVGHNLVEHLAIAVSKFVNVPTYNSEMRPIDMARHMLRFVLYKKGPLVNPAVQSMALARTQPGKVEPDVQLHFVPLAMTPVSSSVSPTGYLISPEPAVSITANICRPHSRGRIRLSPEDPQGLRISHQFLSDERDLRTLIDACRLMHCLFQSAAWKSVIVGDRVPKPVPADDEGWEDHIRTKSTPAYHPVGTCRMGSDDRSVVDPDGRVRGVDGLRVADASVMPAPISANTNAATIMIGEKIADLIACA
jgi:choline dehydrogenase